MRHPATQGRPDANQSAIAEHYRALMCFVLDIHIVPLACDLIVSIPTRRGRILQLVEVKIPGGVIKPHQSAFKREWGDFSVATVRCADDVRSHVECVQRRFK